MSQQLYVMVPGNPEPQLLALDEVARRIQAGELPATAHVVRPGETTWIAAKDLPELAAKLAPAATEPSLPAASPSLAGTSPSLPATPPSLPAAGHEPSQGGDPSHSGAPTPAPVAASAGPRPPSKPGVPKGAVVGVGGAFGLILVGAVGLTVYRNAYSRGLVLEHLPSDCDELYYADLAGIATSDPIAPHVERFLENSKDLADDELGQKSKKDKERFARALEAMRKNGVEPTSVREVAFCVPHVDEDEEADDKVLLVVGGTFRKGDVLRGLKEVAEIVLKDEDACKLEDDDGLRMLKCTPEVKGWKDPVYATLVESRVLALSPDKKTVKSVRVAKDRSKTYGANKGEHLVRYRAKEAPSHDGTFGVTKLAIGSSNTVLTIDVHYDPDKGKKKLAQLEAADELVKKKEKALAAAAEKCFGSKNPLDPLADAVEGTKVEAFDDGLRYQTKIPNKDLGKTFKNLSDADRGDLGKLWKTWFCVYDAVEPYTFK